MENVVAVATQADHSVSFRVVFETNRALQLQVVFSLSVGDDLQAFKEVLANYLIA